MASLSGVSTVSSRSEGKGGEEEEEEEGEGRDKNATSSSPRVITIPLSFPEAPPSQDNVNDRDTTGYISLPVFLEFWRLEIEPWDAHERFFRLIKRRAGTAIEAQDFMSYLEELLAYHPGLAFLETTPEFQEKYARTVIARIFYVQDPSARRFIDVRQLRRGNLLEAFHRVDLEEDINLVNAYFSYEHFYVLYCKFWELDSDHDFLLSRVDLNKLGDLNNFVLDRKWWTTCASPFFSSLHCVLSLPSLPSLAL